MMPDDVASGSVWTAPLVASTLREQARRTLRARIIAGELRPGQLYVVGRIAQELGVSATPIREAVIDLANEGLLVMSRSRGFEVVAVGDQDLDEIIQVRLMLEVPVVRAIAEGRLIPDDTVLRDLIGEMEKAARKDDRVAFLVHDRSFHLAVLGYFGNMQLVGTVARLRAQSRHGLEVADHVPDLLDVIHENDALLDAIMAGDGDRAAAVLEQHVASVLSLSRGGDGVPADADDRPTSRK